MCWLLPRLSLCGLRGLTSIIDHRMKTHYKRSALCLTITVTEKGLMVLPCCSEPSAQLLTKPQSRASVRAHKAETKPGDIKALDLQSLDIGGTSGLQALRGWALARREPPISTISRQALPEGFIYKRTEELSRHRLVLVWFQRMQIHNK